MMDDRRGIGFQVHSVGVLCWLDTHLYLLLRKMLVDYEKLLFVMASLAYFIRASDFDTQP